MKNKITVLLAIFFSFSVLLSKNWVPAGDSNPSKPNWRIDSSSEGYVELSFELNGYFIEEDLSGNSQFTFPGSVPILQSGSPELPRMARSIIIPDFSNMELKILDSKYTEISVENILPSKGNLTRDTDPSSIPHV